MSSFIVLIEWDGNHPPRTYYRRLHKYALRVRGDMSIGPVKRQTVGQDEDNAKALIFQEGAIICKSRSAANQIALLARKMIDQLYKDGEEGRGPKVQGSPAVHVAPIQFGQTITRDRRDLAVMRKLEERLSKPGRPPKPSAFVVTCKECGTVSAITTDAPLNCPSCAGFEIMARKGDLKTYADPGTHIFDAWKRTRFSGSHFEPKDLQDPAPGLAVAPAAPRIGKAADRDLLAAMEASPKLWPLLDTMDRDMAIDYLDAIYLGRRFGRREDRDRRRAEVTVGYLMRVNDPANAPLVEGDPDLVDASAIISEDSIIKWLIHEAPDHLVI